MPAGSSWPPILTGVVELANCGVLVGARPPDLAVGDEAAPDLSVLHSRPAVVEGDLGDPHHLRDAGIGAGTRKSRPAARARRCSRRASRTVERAAAARDSFFIGFSLVRVQDGAVPARRRPTYFIVGRETNGSAPPR